ncbi:HEPN domain-containing protein [Lacunimicrobium album]
MNRPQLQEMSEQRLAEAKLLRDHGFWSGAYYLAGYSIELAIKSCILKRIEMTGIIFVDKNFQMNCWTHDLPKLIKSAELDRELGLTEQSDLAFKANWGTIKDWNEASRY